MLEGGKQGARTSSKFNAVSFQYLAPNLHEYDAGAPQSLVHALHDGVPLSIPEEDVILTLSPLWGGLKHPRHRAGKLPANARWKGHPQLVVEPAAVAGPPVAATALVVHVVGAG